MHQRAGFTLIELSIVLVIIGLIVGGVLVGRDLIEAAAVRAQVSQIEKFDAAVYTFRSKYNALPGDIAASQATAIGFASRSGAKGHGDDDGTLEDCDGVSEDTSSNFGCEAGLFWNDLSVANLVGGNFVLDVDSPSTSDTITIPSGNQNQYFPDAKIGGGNSVALWDVNYVGATGFCSRQTFCYALIANIAATPSVGYTGKAGISPAQALAIDTKMDDGAPNTGRVQGSDPIPEGSGINIGVNSTLAGSCIVTISAPARLYGYNMSNINTPVCVLSIEHR